MLKMMSFLHFATLILALSACSERLVPILANDPDSNTPIIGDPEMPRSGRQNIVNVNTGVRAEFGGTLAVSDSVAYDRFLRELGVCPLTATVSEDNCVQSSNDIYVEFYSLEVKGRTLEADLALLPRTTAPIRDQANDFTPTESRSFSKVW